MHTHTHEVTLSAAKSQALLRGATGIGDEEVQPQEPRLCRPRRELHKTFHDLFLLALHLKPTRLQSGNGNPNSKVSLNSARIPENKRQTATGQRGMGACPPNSKS
eukprot:569332-Amphidinium_carterae.1